MRIMGLDVGERRIGVAVSDPLRLTAQGIRVITRAGGGEEIEEIARLAREYEVGSIVVGLPRNMNGSYGPQAEKVREFAESLRAVVDMPVLLWDERLSTVSAEKALVEADLSRKRRKEVIDKQAAVIILQSYLDSTAHGI